MSRSGGPTGDVASRIPDLLHGGRRIGVGPDFDPDPSLRVVTALEVPGCGACPSPSASSSRCKAPKLTLRPPPRRPATGLYHLSGLVAEWLPDRWHILRSASG